MMQPIKNQYILANDGLNISLPDGWKSRRVAGYNLAVAPDLPLHTYQGEEVSYFLIGVAFHIELPALNENEMLSRLPKEFNAFLNAIDFLSGNFVIIRKSKDSIEILNDNSASLKAFYLLDDSGFVRAVASDPALLSEFFALEEDDSPEARYFYNSVFFTKNQIRLGDRTQFTNVFQILPNHFLDIASAQSIRFFPREKKDDLSLNESIDKTNYYLTNVIEAASRRYNLKCGLTAGWDSRMVLAATKQKKHEVLYYTFYSSNKTEQNKDIEIARTIADNLNLSYKLIDTSVQQVNIQKQELDKNYCLMHSHKPRLIANGFSRFDKGQDLALLGVISEIVKNYYESVIVKDGKTLAKASHFELCDYVINYQQKKYEELKPLCDKYGYNLKDIAHWEQDIANFAAQGIQYNSFALRTFSPFNSREIIKTILATPRKYRDKHCHKFYSNYLKKYWPELLEFPINPTLKKKMIVFTKKVKLYNIYKVLLNNVIK